MSVRDLTRSLPPLFGHETFPEYGPIRNAFVRVFHMSPCEGDFLGFLSFGSLILYLAPLPALEGSSR